MDNSSEVKVGCPKMLVEGSQQKEYCFFASGTLSVYEVIRRYVALASVGRWN